MWRSSAALRKGVAGAARALKLRKLSGGGDAPRRKMTFVSSHFQQDPDAIAAYLERRSLTFRDSQTHFVVKACPLCQRPHGDKLGNQFKLYVQKKDGAYFCHRCGSCGSWYDFKQKMGDVPAESDMPATGSLLGKPAGGRPLSTSTASFRGGAALVVSSPTPSSAAEASSSSSVSRTIDADFVMQASRALLDENKFPDVLDYLVNTRKLTVETLRLYGVGAVERSIPVFPDNSTAAAPSLGIPMPGVGGLGVAAPPLHHRAASGVSKKAHHCIVFPWMTATPTRAVSAIKLNAAPTAAADPFAAREAGAVELSCTRIKLRSVTDKAVQMLLPRGGGWGMFGWHVLPLISGGGISAAGSAAASAGLPSAAPGIGALGPGLGGMFTAPGIIGGSSFRGKFGAAAGNINGASLAAAAAASSGDSASVVLTEGEFDAMSVFQETGVPAVSLPNGCRSMPVELLPWLERFSRVYLWMDDDMAGREGCERISAKLGLGRCYIVRPRAELIIPKVAQAALPATAEAAEAAGAAAAATAPSLPPPPPASKREVAAVTLPKDANEALQRGLQLRPLLAAAAPRAHDQILGFGDLREAVMREVAAGIPGLAASQGGGGGAGGGSDGARRSGAGVPLRSMPRLQHLLKGHRAGELTILTGPTGSGKTTLLTQLSLDLALQGVRTLWGSFEIKHARLVAAMLAQLRGGRVPLSTCAGNSDAAAALIALSEALAGGSGSGSSSAGGSSSGGESEVDVVAEEELALAALPVAATAAAASGPAAARFALPPVMFDAAAGSIAPIGALGGDSDCGGGGGGIDRDVGPASAAAARRLLLTYERAADVLGALPVRFLRFYGSTDVDRVVDALEYAAYAHDTEHVILDNLQFMMAGGGSGFERYELQERALDKFRAFATRHDVHVTLVIHPRKEPEDAPLSMASVFGSAKATQEADSVLILQRSPEGRKYLDLRKNRYDGTLGMVPVEFDADAKSFYEQDAVATPALPPAPGGGGGGGGGGGTAPWRRPGLAGPPGSRSMHTTAAAAAGAAGLPSVPSTVFPALIGAAAAAATTTTTVYNVEPLLASRRKVASGSKALPAAAVPLQGLGPVGLAGIGALGRPTHSVAGGIGSIGGSNNLAAAVGPTLIVSSSADIALPPQRRRDAGPWQPRKGGGCGWAAAEAGAAVASPGLLAQLAAEVDTALLGKVLPAFAAAPPPQVLPLEAAAAEEQKLRA